MSSIAYQNKITQKQRELSRLTKSKTDEMKKISNSNKKISTAQNTIKRSKSQTTINSKSKEIQRALDDIAKCNKKITELETKILKKEREIIATQNLLAKEIEKENNGRINNINIELGEQKQMQEKLESRITKIENLPKSINVLIMTSNPINTTALRLDEEVRSIQEMLRKSEHRDAVKLESRWATRTIDILQAINEIEPTIVHFSGHGAANGDIFVQNNDGMAKGISKETMVQVLKSTTDKIKLVFFNSCFSSFQAEEVIKHIPCAIGMSDTIEDKAAEVFAAQFYSAIGFGKSVKVAFEQAKAALMLEGAREEIPILYTQEGIDAENLYIVESVEA